MNSPETLIPAYLLDKDVKGHIEGTTGKFTHNGQGNGVYKYQTMSWDTVGGSHGQGYSLSFSYSTATASTKCNAIVDNPIANYTHDTHDAHKRRRKLRRPRLLEK